MNAAAVPKTGAEPNGPAPCPILARAVVLVGLMGAGKSSVGRRLARLLNAPFTDSDDEVVAAARMSIADIFAVYGEATFRDLERRVIVRLLDEPPAVLALGGGAFIDPAVRARIEERATSIWLRADLETLVARTGRKRGIRPLLQGDDPRRTLASLIERRHPIYAHADHVLDTAAEPPEAIAASIAALLGARTGGKAAR